MNLLMMLPNPLQPTTANTHTNTHFLPGTDPFALASCLTPSNTHTRTATPPLHNRYPMPYLAKLSFTTDASDTEIRTDPAAKPNPVTWIPYTVFSAT